MKGNKTSYWGSEVDTISLKAGAHVDGDVLHLRQAVDDKISHEMANLKQKAVRQALINAGWTPPAEPGERKEVVTIGQLWVGDRFVWNGDLWTYLGEGTARKHSKESIALGKNGHGYIGDSICIFENERVIFIGMRDF